MLTRHAMTRRADEDRVDAIVVERDYVLAHIVAQLHRLAPGEGKQLVFKGGTALRFVHLDQYRYSADLDFTALGLSADESVGLVAVAIAAARDHAELPHLEVAKGDPPSVEYIGPLGAGKPRKVKLDIATDEHVETVAQLRMGAIWEDLPAAQPFDVYPIDEIAGEKLRCIIQRVQCRDLYDLYRLSDDRSVSLEEIRPLFERKAQAKGLDPGTFAARFEDRVDRYASRWDGEMGEHLAEPPPFDTVERVMRRNLRAAALIG